MSSTASLKGCTSLTRRTIISQPQIRLDFSPRPLIRCYATQQSLGTTKPPPSRKSVTILNDDGLVQWGDLSAREKAARTAQQSFNALTIVTGALMFGAVGYLLYTEVFASDSRTAQFNRAFDRVREDPRCVELLGSSRKMKAYGEPTWNKLSRNRPIAHTKSVDQRGREHLKMHFHVEGPLAKGTVRLHMIKPRNGGAFEYQTLALDVAGQSRVWIENKEAESDSKSSWDGKKIFGFRLK